VKKVYGIKIINVKFHRMWKFLISFPSPAGTQPDTQDIVGFIPVGCFNVAVILSIDYPHLPPTLFIPVVQYWEENHADRNW
jgi:hypothetical protein